MLRMKITVRIMNDIKMMTMLSMVEERDSLATLRDAKNHTNGKHILQTILQVILLMIQHVNDNIHEMF